MPLPACMSLHPVHAVPEEEAITEHQIPWNWISWMTVGPYGKQIWFSGRVASAFSCRVIFPF